jgi:hypothetical protein
MVGTRRFTEARSPHCERKVKILAANAQVWYQNTPKTVQEAFQFDKENGNHLWWEAICKVQVSCLQGSKGLSVT